MSSTNGNQAAELPALKLILVAGARPNFMKIAPLVHAIERHNSQKAADVRPIDFCLVHTGQHYDPQMSDVFFKELGIPKPDCSLDVGSGSHAVQTANVMARFEPVCQAEKPDWVVVVGDVNSTMACTLVAVKMGIRVAHIEAGLRSFDRTMPEEINRLVTDSIADLLLTPSEDANENLRREGAAEARIQLVGNIMIDALVANLEQARQSQILATHGLIKGDYIYVTLHRPANVDRKENLASILRELSALAEKTPVVFPMHPRTRKMIAEFNLSFIGKSGVKVLDPIGYHDSLCLTENARLVLTDSGGLQEESTYFRTPCLTLRPNTERPVTVTMGSNRLTALEALHADMRQTLAGTPRLGSVPPLWDGRTAERVVERLLGV